MIQDNQLPASIYEKLEELQLNKNKDNNDYIQGKIDSILWMIEKYKINLK